MQIFIDTIAMPLHAENSIIFWIFTQDGFPINIFERVSKFKYIFISIILLMKWYFPEKYFPKALYVLFIVISWICLPHNLLLSYIHMSNSIFDKHVRDLKIDAGGENAKKICAHSLKR